MFQNGTMNGDVTGELRDDAFHITAAANVASILTDGFRTNRRGVLGTGAYFDLGSETTGVAPAQQRYPNQPLVVLQCEVALGRVLDLDRDETGCTSGSFNGNWSNISAEKPSSV